MSNNQNYKDNQYNNGSEVPGISEERMQELKLESRNAFAPTLEKLQSRRVDMETLSSPEKKVPLDPRKVGAMALQEDIQKSLVDPARGVRDFYNKTYSEHGTKRLQQKELDLNLPITRDVAKARQGLNKYESFNALNASALDSLNDGLISAMRDIHKEEIQKNPHDVAMQKRHKVEVALFDYRENEQKLGDKPEKKQTVKDSFSQVQKSHIAFIEEKWGKTLDPQKTPSVNEEIVKMSNSALTPPQTQKKSLTSKIAMHR